jgi:hypothetical protein
MIYTSGRENAFIKDPFDVRFQFNSFRWGRAAF